MRPCMGKVSPSTASARWGSPVLRRALIPLSDSARLMDLFQVKGAVDEEYRRSNVVSQYIPLHA